MKNCYLIVFFFISLILASCSSNYTLKDFSSKEKFYEDFNKSVKYKNVKIILTNDSSFISLEGTKIINDTLVVILYPQNEEREIPIERIKEVSYKNHWLGLPLGFLTGTIIGIGIGGAISSYDAHTVGDPLDIKNEYLLPLIYGTLLGSITGSVAGWFVGWNYIYEFNP